MGTDFVFTEDEIAVDEALGYPKAYAKLCRDKSFGPFSQGPPFTYTPYGLVQDEETRSEEIDDIFPIIDRNAKPTTKPKIFVSLLWKQLNHLGNAGFDPEIIRVDPYGNVLYYHADASSPLAWDVDHWFPCTRGGLTVASNLRLLQWQVCKRKHNKLEFLIPWWDLQLGISINQFLSIFASSNSDFRHRAFSWLFSQGECEELNDSQTVDSHVFPQRFLESKDRLGLAPAALNRPMRSLDANRRPKSSTPIIATKKMKQQNSKENEDPLMLTYHAIAMARDSLKEREEAYKMQAEMQRLDGEAGDLHRKAEEEKLTIQEMEAKLLKKKRRVEKCRRLAESQSSYKAILEKMIRDAMHQSVVYKEQVRLNQAAANALMARLEAQKAICDSAERELRRRCKKRDELEKEVIKKPEWESSTRKRLRIDSYEIDDDEEVNNEKMATSSSSSSAHHKQLKKFLEEEQRASSSPPYNDESTSIKILKPGEKEEELKKKDYVVEERLENLEIEEGGETYGVKFPSPSNEEEEDGDGDEERRRMRGKVNIEKWVQFLYENSAAGEEEEDEGNETTDELIEKLNRIYPQKVKRKGGVNEGKVEIKERSCSITATTKGKENVDKNTEAATLMNKNPPYRIKEKEEGKRRLSVGGENVLKECNKEKELKRCESARGFRRIPSSPSLLLEGVKKKVDCIRKKKLFGGA